MSCDEILASGNSIRKWVITFTVLAIVALVYLILLSTQSLIDYDFTTELDDIITNWRTNSISALSSGSTCNENLINYVWPGLIVGCDCTSVVGVADVYTSSCSVQQNNAGCVSVTKQSSATLQTWADASSALFIPCVNRLASSTFIDAVTDSSSGCSQLTYSKCDTNQSLCFSSCPVSNIVSKSDSQLSQYSSNVLGNVADTLFYTTTTTNPIIDVKTQIPNVCFKTSSTTSTSGSNYYSLLKDSPIVNCDETDTRYVSLIDSTATEIAYLQLNGITSVSTYPGYPTTRIPHIYVRRMIAWDTATCTRQLAMDLISFYDGTDSQRTKRGVQIGFIVSSFLLIGLIGFLSSCECGFRNGVFMCCNYKAPSCLIVLTRKTSLEPSMYDYCSLYDPCYVIFAALYMAMSISTLVVALIIYVDAKNSMDMLSSIVGSGCSDTLTNRILTSLYNDFDQNVYEPQWRIGVISVAMNILQMILLVYGLRIVTANRRKWFTEKLSKTNRSELSTNDPVLTSEESEEEKSKKEAISSAFLDKQKEMQIQILQADFLQRTNLLNQSISQFQSSRFNQSNNTSGPQYVYELQRISQLQQNQSMILQQNQSILQNSMNPSMSMTMNNSMINHSNNGNNNNNNNHNKSSDNINNSSFHVNRTTSRDRFDSSSNKQGGSEVFSNNYFNFAQTMKQEQQSQVEQQAQDHSTSKEYQNYATKRSWKK